MKKHVKLIAIVVIIAFIFCNAIFPFAKIFDLPIFDEENDVAIALDYSSYTEFSSSASDFSSGKKYTISTKEALVAFSAKLSENTFSGVTFVLLSDIVLNNTTFNADGTYSGDNPTIWAGSGAFAGTFDGNGFTISGMYLALATATNVGMFQAAFRLRKTQSRISAEL